MLHWSQEVSKSPGFSQSYFSFCPCPNTECFSVLFSESQSFLILDKDWAWSKFQRRSLVTCSFTAYMQTPANEEPFPAFLHVGKYKVFIYYLKISYKNRMCFDCHIQPYSFLPNSPQAPSCFPPNFMPVHGLTLTYILAVLIRLSEWELCVYYFSLFLYHENFTMSIFTYTEKNTTFSN